MTPEQIFALALEDAETESFEGLEAAEKILDELYGIDEDGMRLSDYDYEGNTTCEHDVDTLGYIEHLRCRNCGWQFIRKELR